MGPGEAGQGPAFPQCTKQQKLDVIDGQGRNNAIDGGPEQPQVATKRPGPGVPFRAALRAERRALGPDHRDNRT